MLDRLTKSSCCTHASCRFAGSICTPRLFCALLLLAKLSNFEIWAAEYDVVPHMNAMCTSTVVDYMYVEWHAKFKSISKKAKERAQAAKTAMEAAGTQFPQYDSPA